MLSKEQLALAKSRPDEFLEMYRTDFARLFQLYDEIEVEKKCPNEERLSLLLREANDIKRQRERMYSFITDNISDVKYQYVLIAFFLQNKKMLEIAENLGFTSRRWTQTLKVRALKAFADAI